MRTVGQAGTQAIRRCRQIFDSGRTEYDIEMAPAGEVENRRYWPRWSSSSDKSYLDGPPDPARSLARRVISVWFFASGFGPRTALVRDRDLCPHVSKNSRCP